MIPIIQLLKIASKIVRGTLLLIVDHVLDFKVNFFWVIVLCETGQYMFLH